MKGVSVISRRLISNTTITENLEETTRSNPEIIYL